jgi:peptidoglycan/xylan/chitin deacetylase (PgdA/CDA1 family)
VYEGFTVANHTLRHPHLTQLPPEQARREIEDGRDALEELFGYRIDGFAYPYGDQNEEVRELVRSAGHLYARPVSTTRSVFPPDDPMDFKPSCHFLAENFWQEFDSVRLSRGVFYFWGHSYEIVTEEDWRAFDEKIERLSQEGEWISLPSLFRQT